MPIVTDALVGYWNSKQGVTSSVWENIAPSTKGKYNGIISGALSQNEGLSFDGIDDSVKVLALQESDNSNRYEFEIYINVHSLLADNDYMLGLIGMLRMDMMSSITEGFILAYDQVESVLIVSNTLIPYTIPLNSLLKINLNWDISTQLFSLFINDISIVQNINDPRVTLLSPTRGSFGIGSTDIKTTMMGQIYSEGMTNSFYGHIKSVKLYKRHLTSQERAQNTIVGDTIGLDESSVPSTPSVILISANKMELGKHEETNQSIITIRFDKNVIEYVARLNGTSYDTGTLVHQGGSVSANTNAQVIVDWNELTTEGQNRINIYGKGTDGSWTPYNK